MYSIHINLSLRTPEGDKNSTDKKCIHGARVYPILESQSFSFPICFHAMLYEFVNIVKKSRCKEYNLHHQLVLKYMHSR